MSKEHLSALLDGECSDQELDRLLDQMERDPSLKADWSRMCRNRELAAGVQIKQTQACICADVMSKIEGLPDQSVVSKVVDIASRRRHYAWKPIAGLAAAASVATVALLAGLSPTAKEAGPAVEAVQSPPVYGQQLVAVQSRDEDLDNYLIEHSNSMADQGMGGTLRYARFAAHTAAYSPDGQP